MREREGGWGGGGGGGWRMKGGERRGDKEELVKMRDEMTK